MSTNNTIVIIGGGAAGYFAAINAAENHQHAKIILLEKTGKTLQKVKVSGGGRCNVTHHCFDTQTLSKNYPRGEKEMQQAFHQFAVKDTVEWFAKRGVKLKTENDQRMFPVSNTSQTIIDCFEQQVKQLGIKVYLNSEVEQISKEEQKFSIVVKAKPLMIADYVIVTSGGFNQLKGYHFLSSFNLDIIHPLPSLFTFNLENKNITSLMGLSVPHAAVTIVNNGMEQKGPLLITHWGFSGPAVLKLSAFAAVQLAALNYHFDIAINWNHDYTTDTLRRMLIELKNSSAKVWSGLYHELNIPRRLHEFLLQEAQLEGAKKLAETSNKSIELFCNLCCNHPFKIKGKTTFKEEFVTCGGIDLKEVNFKTMMCRKVPGLYFAGEVLDVDGITGGFNFQAAWTTAHIAAQLKP